MGRGTIGRKGPFATTLFKKGVGLFSRVGLFLRDCGTCTIHAKIYPLYASVYKSTHVSFSLVPRLFLPPVFDRLKYKNRGRPGRKSHVHDVRVDVKGASARSL